jgi:hypothetical protein
MSGSPPPVFFKRQKKRFHDMSFISGKIAAMSGCYGIPQRATLGVLSIRMNDLFLSFRVAGYPFFGRTGDAEFLLNGGSHFLLVFQRNRFGLALGEFA